MAWLNSQTVNTAQNGREWSRNDDALMAEEGQ
jgi:hypothetical protein